ncbi:alcohol dehydrogenase catalytic domain-containing protein [Leucobacter salsicius]|uniref:alcohol dehydrogenase catalytic domain-containing protein n=1 Tax=Leucobacter salsicius TaxID=664638 RepID=UPI00034C3892|nr:alcohol dehydrogenase catalytic domain-containing protein [Leucobacter salsicius]
MSTTATPRTIRGAVLNTLGAQAPYASSRPISVDTLTLGDPGAQELLVRIEAASICHSDLSVVNGSRPRPVPMLLGHEAAGIVEQLGEGVTDLKLGQRVVLTFLPRCGECAQCGTDGRLPCSEGSRTNEAGTLLEGSRHLTRDGESIHHHLGCSGFAEYAVVDRRSVVAVGDDVPADIAAVLGCAVLTGGGAVLNAAKLQASNTIAVVGLGGVGMAALLTALGIGPREVYAVDANEAKLELAREWGVTSAFTPQQAVEQGITADVVIEAVGHPRAFETAYQLIGFGGTLVTVGLPAPGAMSEIEPLKLTARAQQVIGSYLGSAVPSRDIPKFEQLWREGKLPLERLISGTIDLDDINEGMDALASGTVLRQIIRMPQAAADPAPETAPAAVLAAASA